MPPPVAVSEGLLRVVRAELRSLRFSDCREGRISKHYSLILLCLEYRGGSPSSRTPHLLCWLGLQVLEDDTSPLNSLFCRPSISSSFSLGIVELGTQRDI